MRLKIAAKVDKVDQDYFKETIEPMLDDPLVEFIGEIGERRNLTFLGNASALLFPIDWPEPFGLVMIEAMACGTPVIAWRSGSVPEVVTDGTTGYIVREGRGGGRHSGEQTRSHQPAQGQARIRATLHGGGDGEQLSATLPSALCRWIEVPRRSRAALELAS